MGNKKVTSRPVNGITRPEQPYTNQGTQLFFNQRPTPPALEAGHHHEAQQIQEIQPVQEAQQVEPVEELRLETTTDILLFAILKELKTRNVIELAKLQAEQEKEQKELQDAEEMQARDEARFEGIRSSMYL
ncbi:MULTISPECIES: hypothetical protein [unclassified Legionella]|uniref:hypothetical protein n=1 Tax=unclassified Legionella TaxID=2622702 RepID=UPI003AF510FC